MSLHYVTAKSLLGQLVHTAGGGGLSLLDGLNPGGETDCESEVSKYPQCNDYGWGHFIVFSAMTPGNSGRDP